MHSSAKSRSKTSLLYYLWCTAEPEQSILTVDWAIYAFGPIISLQNTGSGFSCVYSRSLCLEEENETRTKNESTQGNLGTPLPSSIRPLRSTWIFLLVKFWFSLIAENNVVITARLSASRNFQFKWFREQFIAAISSLSRFLYRMVGKWKEWASLRNDKLEISKSNAYSISCF